MLGGEKHRAKGHRALIAEFDWSRSRQIVKLWIPPKAMELPKKPPQTEDELGLSYLESLGQTAQNLEEALGCGDSVEAGNRLACRSDRGK